MIIVWGYRRHLKSMGWTAQKCSRCRKIQAFRCFDNVQANHVYFIYGETRSIGRVIQCSFCETGFALNKKDQFSLKIDSDWKHFDGLQKLVDRTNPQFGQIPVSNQPTRSELFALLESVNERSNPFKLSSGGGFLVGAVLGGLGLGFLMFLLTTAGVNLGLDQFGSAFLGLLAGGIVGGIVSAFKTKFNVARNVAEEILVDSMARNNLTLQMLKRALKQHPSSLRYVTAAIELIEAD